MASDFNAYLDKIGTRSAEMVNSIGKLQVHQGHQLPPWPTSLQRFTTIATQFDALYHDVYGCDVLLPEMELSQRTVMQPAIEGYDPTHSFRVKPLMELEQQQADLLDQYSEEHDTTQETAHTLKAGVNAWNDAIAELGRSLAQQTQQLKQTADAEAADAQRARGLLAAKGPCEEAALGKVLRCKFDGRLVRRDDDVMMRGATGMSK